MTLVILLPVAFEGSASGDPGGKYTGPGSCSSPSCHGAVQARSDNSVLQTEYGTWVVRDKHSRAASVLTDQLSKGIGRILDLRPDTSERCLACHSLNVPEEEKSRSFDSDEGVSCESCHGPASNWLGQHTTRGWNYDRSVEQGMTNTRDLIKRSEICLSCHLGTDSKWVDHQMIAAGHPDLYFELDSFSAAMPAHWKEVDPDPWVDLRVLVVGEAVQLRENMRRIVRDTARFWPEYSELDCFACHHSLTTAADSWRQQHGYSGRRAGNPAWNSSRYAVFKLILAQLDLDDARQLEQSLARTNALVSDVTADRRAIASAAQATADIADRIAHHLAGHSFDAAAALQLVKAISGRADWVSYQGERSAEQAVMVLNSLVIAYCKNARVAPATEAQLKAWVAGLFQLVENPSAYLPESFAAQLRAFTLEAH